MMLINKGYYRKYSRYFSIFLICILLIGGVIPSSLGIKAFAEGIEDGFKITKAKMTLNDKPINEITEPIKQNATVKLEYTWALDNEYDAQAGNKISVPLPDELNYGTDKITGDLVDENSEKYGTWTMDPSTKNLELELGELPTERSNVHGTVQLNLKFTVDTMVVDIPYELKIPLSGGAEQSYIINFEIPSGPVVKKSGTQSSTDANVLTWTVDINRNLETVSLPIVSDKIDSLLGYEENSLKVYELTPKSDGSVVADANPIADTNYDVVYDGVPNLLTVAFKAPIDHAYRLVYDTRIQPETIDTSKTSFAYSNHVSFHNASDTAMVQVTRKPLIIKGGQADRAFNANKIAWSINVNQSLYSLTNAKVEDSIPTGLTIDESSIKVYKMPEKTPVNSEEYTIGYDDGNKKITLDFKNIINQEYLVEYDTSVNSDTKKNNNSSIAFTNNAKLSHEFKGDTKVNTANKTVTLAKGAAIKKSGVASIGYNNEKYITWTVDLNLSEIDLNTAIFSDVIGPNHKLDKDSIKIYPLSIDNSKTNNNITLGSELNNGADYNVNLDSTDSDHKFSVDFGSNIKTPYRIVYKTVITDKNTQDFTNSAYIGPIGGTPNVTAKITPTIANTFAKVNTGVNYATKELTWKITVNPIQQGIENLVITDTFTPGLQMTDKQLKDLVVKKGDVPLEKDTDYTLTPTVPDSKIKGFVVSFQDKGHIVNEQIYTIEYGTTMDPDVLSNNGDLTYKNTAVFTFDGGSQTKTATPTISPNALHNGSKSGMLDTANKKINWTIYTNFLSKNLNHFEVTDTIQGNQKLVVDSIKIYEYAINASGAITVGNLIDPDAAGFSIEKADDGKSFKITYPDSINSPYLVTYSTAFVGISQTVYNNTAQTNKDESYSANVNYADGDKFVSKTGTRVGTTYVNWQITLNKSQSMISSFTLTDRLSEGLELVKDSFIVKKANNTEVDFGTLFTLNVRPRALSTDPQVFDLISKKPIAESYTIDYKTNLILDEILENKVFNNVIFDGEQVISGVRQSTVPIVYTFVTGSGTGTGEVGSFTLKKVDESGNPLKGARFEFYKGTKFIGELITDQNGEAKANRLKYASYSLKEIEAPVGYQIINPNVNFTINNTSEQLITVRNDNLRTLEIIKNEKSKPTEFLKNAVFEIKNDVLLHTITTDSTGKASVILPYGTYKVKEITAPSGYIKDSKEFVITIAQGDKMEDGITPQLVYTLMVENEKIINSGGSKTDPKPDSKPDPKPEQKPDPQPQSKKEEHKTPQETPTDGKVKVPDGSKPEVKAPPTNGKVTINEDGKWIYTPNPGFTGKDKFTLTVIDPDSGSEDIIIEIETEKVPLAAVDANQSPQTGQGHLPQTGQGVPWISMILGIAMVLIGGYLVYIKKRLKSRN